MLRSKEIHDTTMPPLRVRGNGAHAPAGMPGSVPTSAPASAPASAPMAVPMSAPHSGIVDRIMRVPLSGKVLGANLLVALIALLSLFIAHKPGETLTQSLVVAVCAVGFSLVANIILVTVALRPLRELERTAQRVWAGDLSVRARSTQTEDQDLGRVRSAINLLLDGMHHDRARMRRLALHAITVGDGERARVGRELHESSAQWLAGLTLELSAMARATKDPEAQAQLEHMREMAQHVMEQVRVLSETLHPRVLDDLGLAPALQHLARRTSERGVSTTADTSGADAAIPRHVASVLYDVAREAVANAARHASPARVELLLTTDGGRVRLAVRDDGRGMDVEEKERGGFGLFSMRERVALVNGVFTLESLPGDGTRVVATVALDAEDGR
jgi:signal transduction histidine kinase